MNINEFLLLNNTISCRNNTCEIFLKYRILVSNDFFFRKNLSNDVNIAYLQCEFFPDF